MSTTPNALASAKAALEKANNFTSNVTGGKPNALAPKSEQKSGYSHAREARGGEFMGIRSDEAPELNAALKTREDAKKALQ